MKADIFSYFCKVHRRTINIIYTWLMKRYILTLSVMLSALSSATAQTFDALWRKAAEAAEKDQPLTELSVVRQISAKAQASKSYGNLLAAELRGVTLLGCVSSDSIAPAVQRLEKRVGGESDPRTKALWHAALAKLYLSNTMGIDLRGDSAVTMPDKWNGNDKGLEQDNIRRARTHLQIALSNMPLLASLHATAYAPLTSKGVAEAFGHDLLHVVGLMAGKAPSEIDDDGFTRAGVLGRMHDYYEGKLNRKAACLCALEMLRLANEDGSRTVHQSSYLQQLDSLTSLYRDLQEAGAVALTRYDNMDAREGVSARERIEYIDRALAQWGSWPGMARLRNARKDLTNPLFEFRKCPLVSLPGKSQWFVIEKARNIQCLTVKVSRLGITADNDYNVSDEKTYKELLGKVAEAGVVVRTKTFKGYPDYQTVRDSVEIPGLPIGAYLMEVTADGAAIEPYRHLFYVSDLSLMAQLLPSDVKRYVAVSATTGQPIAGAKIVVYSDNKRSGKKHRTVLSSLTTDNNGEATSTAGNGQVWLTAGADQYTPASWLYVNRNRYYENKTDKWNVNMFTDRSIYRPGQTVHATAVCFVRKKGFDAEACDGDGKELKMVLRNANNKVVEEKSVTLDKYGTASADFQLPQDGLTGMYSLETSIGVWNRKYIKVEEYKRPTFQVTFEKLTRSYAWGDTVVVKGIAKTYAGVPVQGAAVTYTVQRNSAWWWWRSKNSSEDITAGDTKTAADGSFEVSVPFVPVVDDNEGSGYYARRRANFYDFDIKATVTDLGGESHEGSTSLPIGTRPTAFSVDLPENIMRDSMKTVTFSYRNSAGTDLAGKVSYRIGQDAWRQTDANVPVSMKTMRKEWPSGRYLLEAVCGEDTLRQSFVVYTMHDTRPATDTRHWYAQSAAEFPADGRPVYVQVGSSDKAVHVVYSIVAGDSLLEKGVWNISDSIVTRNFVYRPEYASGVVLNYAFVKEGTLYKGKIEVKRPLPDKTLKTAWKTFRNRLHPGQKEEWTLSVTTPDGKPAKAQLLSVLYDKSLDQIKNNRWCLSLGLFQYLPNSYWTGNLSGRTFSVGGAAQVKYEDVTDCTFDSFVDEYFKITKSYRMDAMPLASVAMKNTKVFAAASNRMAVGYEGDGEAVSIKGYGSAQSEEENNRQSREDAALDSIPVRENLVETAFYYPALETDSKGCVSLKFTLPESVTTWKFMGLAHDMQMRHTIVEDEVVARKTVMVQPNLPRFLREGDKAVVLVKVFNTTEQKQNGKARMQFIDPETEKVVWQGEQRYAVDANGTAVLSFAVEGLEEGLYINKVVATAGNSSDGEQSYVPVLSNRELVCNTLPLTLDGKGNRTFDLSPLYVDKEGKSLLGEQTSRNDAVQALRDARITVEFTENPSWMMIQALPSLSNMRQENAVSLMAAVYSNTIARHIMHQSPIIKQVMELWRRENTSDGKKGESLSSCLEKNQELKSLVLSETPWVLDADRESEQRQQLVNYFDETQCASRLSAQIAKLKSLQNADGSFSWWKGMEGSRYMTTSVAKMLVRLNTMLGKQSETAGMLRSALSFLHRKATEEVDEIKKEKVRTRPSEEAIDYLYILALDGTPRTAAVKNTADYLLGRMAERTGEFTIYGKALAAVVLGKNGYTAKASEYLKSISEYTVYKPEMGRYFDTRNAYYSWCDYRIPTQVAAIEAMQLLAAGDTTARREVTEMKRWLLQSKRTQAWDTPLNTVDAVFAFMKDNVQVLEKTTENASLSLDGKALTLSKATAGLGYVKVAKDGTARSLTINKQSTQTSWAAVYAQYTMPASEVASAESGIRVVRKVENMEALGVGDKVKVTLVITADRDYDFVQVVDKRAACLEPVNQLSGYQWGMGCYVAPADHATKYYFGRLSKGRHVVETAYYVDRKGNYLSGTCSAQCAYSPEFGGRAEAYSIVIDK